MVHTPGGLKSKVKKIPKWAAEAPDVLPLVHVITPNHKSSLENRELQADIREKMRKDMLENLKGIVESGTSLTPEHDRSSSIPSRLGEPQAVYFFWGIAYPQIGSQAVFLIKFAEEHFDQTKATPFDTGAVLRERVDTPPKWGYGRHVIDCTLTEMPQEGDECSCSPADQLACNQKRVDCVNNHSASGYEAIKEYFTCYLSFYFKDTLAYLTGNAKRRIDGYDHSTEPEGNRRTCAFEVRSFSPVSLIGHEQQWILTQGAFDLLTAIGHDRIVADMSIVDDPVARTREILEPIC